MATPPITSDEAPLTPARVALTAVDTERIATAV